MSTELVKAAGSLAIAPARARTHAVRFKKDGRERVMQAWREGHLAAVTLPELTAGGAS